MNPVVIMVKEDLETLLYITDMEKNIENFLNVKLAISDSLKGVVHSSLGYIQKSQR